MDPDANLKEQITIARHLLDRNPTAPINVDTSLVWEADRLAELVCALDDWITGGGFLPERWQRGPIINATRKQG